MKNKLPRESVRRLHQLRQSGWTYPMLCREFHISSTQVGRILSGEQRHDVWLEFHDPQGFEKWKLEQQGVMVGSQPTEMDEAQLAAELIEIQRKSEERKRAEENDPLRDQARRYLE